MAQRPAATSLNAHTIYPDGFEGMTNEQNESTALESKTNPRRGLNADMISSFNRILGELDNQDSSASSVYKRTMRNGILGLLGQISIPGNQVVWDDAMEYCRSVIESPQDSEQRAQAHWKRSCSDLCRLLLSRFGPQIVAAARSGCTAFINAHYHGNPLGVAHVDKKENAKRYLTQQDPGAVFQPNSSLLAVACFEIVGLCCAISTSGWLSPEEATKYAMISHVAVADDYHKFTATENDPRLRMIALAIGAAYEAGGQAVNTLVDGTALQAVGTGQELTVDAVMAWRAVGGCTTPYSGHLWGDVSLEDGLVVPEVMMGIHDVLDWRCDAAARNHENGIFAIYGLGAEDPFHTYLEAVLRRASSHPVSGAYTMAGIVFLHYTSIRYGSYHYKGGTSRNWQPLIEWEHLLKDITLQAGLRWEPAAPPDSFAAGESYRKLARQTADRSQWTAPTSARAKQGAEDKVKGHPCAQHGISWLQYLIVTGQIRLFDALVDIDAVDSTANWA